MVKKGLQRNTSKCNEASESSGAAHQCSESFLQSGVCSLSDEVVSANGVYESRAVMKLISITTTSILLALYATSALSQATKPLLLCGATVVVPKELKIVPPEKEDCTYSTYSPDGQISIYNFPVSQYLDSEFSKYKKETSSLKSVYRPTARDDRYFYYSDNREYSLNLSEKNLYFGLRPVNYTDEIGNKDIPQKVFCVDFLAENEGKTLDYGFCFKSEKKAKNYLLDVRNK